MLRSIWWSLKHSEGLVSMKFGFRCEELKEGGIRGCWMMRLLRTLEDLEVLEVGVFGVDIELDTRHWDIEVDRIEDLAKSRPAT